MAENYIPFFRPNVSETAIAAVAETMRSGWLTSGPQTTRFEEEFRRYAGAEHAIAVNSCTAALHLALAASGIGPGDDVLVPTLTFAATAEVVIHLGARPILVDCEADTLNIDPAAAEAALTAHTRAIMPVHYAGHPADMGSILDLAAAHDLVVIEDAAHALPTHYRGKMVGTIGDVTCFSFYANKTITTGEGGMITTADAVLADRMRSLRLHGLSLDAWKRFTAEGSWDYDILYPGYKYNMTDIAAALGIEQLRHCDEFHAARTVQAARYTEAFADLPEVTPLEVASDVGHAWHLYVVRLDLDTLNIDRAEFIHLLHEAGIGSSVHYKPLHMHPLFQTEYGYRESDMPVASAMFHRMVSLPLYPQLSAADQERVIDTVHDVVAKHRVTV